MSVESCDRVDGGYAEPLSNARQEEEEEEEEEAERYFNRTAVTLLSVEKEGMDGGSAGGTSWSSSRENRHVGRDDDFFQQEGEGDPSMASAEDLYIAAGRKRCRRDPHGGGEEIGRGSVVSSGVGGSGSGSGGTGGGDGGEMDEFIGDRGNDGRRSRGGGAAKGPMPFQGAPPWSGRLTGALRPPVGVGGDGVGEAVADSSPERERRRPSVRRRVDTDRDGRTVCR